MFHFRWTSTFLYVYVCFVWVIVSATRQYSWPYPFMQTYATPLTAYGSYFGVLVLNAITFILWKFLNVGKVKFHTWVRGSDSDVLNVQEEAVCDRFLSSNTGDLVEGGLEFARMPRNESQV